MTLTASGDANSEGVAMLDGGTMRLRWGIVVIESRQQRCNEVGLAVNGCVMVTIRLLEEIKSIAEYNELQESLSNGSRIGITKTNSIIS